MCGIVAYLGSKNAQSVLVEGLARLEYRGYDSAGIATIHQGQTQLRRSVGKLIHLQEHLRKEPCPGSMGIGHTRWATHGRPSEENAHPHRSEKITVVHNGIIENHIALREELKQQGRVFLSDTDTEIFAHLIAMQRTQEVELLDALRYALSKVKGAFAIAVIDEDSPENIVFARMASPLVVGIGENESFLASDIPAVLSHTRRFQFLHDGDYGRITPDGIQIFDASNAEVSREIKKIDWSPVMAEKGGHKHFMHKEIFEQPRALMDTIRGRLDPVKNKVSLDQVNEDILNTIERITIVACGTSFHSGLLGRYIIEDLSRIPVQVNLASEYRYRNPIVEANTLTIAISQSGETADTLAAIQKAKSLGSHVLAISNVIDSAIPRLCAQSAGILYTRAGPEIGVASTKAFITQLANIHILGLYFAQKKNTLDAQTMKAHIESITQIPRYIENLLHQENDIKSVAQQFTHYNHMLYLGRGTLYPIALEGALKLKEISYIHAEGYAAGEMKHGPIALIDEDMPVVVVATKGHGYDKVVSNLEEVRARAGQIISLCSESDEHLKEISKAYMTIS